MGRWSRLVAAQFLDWLALPAAGRLLEIACGTGALSAAILAQTAPATLIALDRSTSFLAVARHALARHAVARRAVPAVHLAACDAAALPLPAAQFDAVLSGLALNFFPDPAAALRQMRRAVRPGGLVAGYIWDYPGGMQMLRAFWDAAAALDPAARALDQGRRHPYDDAVLAALFRDAGLRAVQTTAVEVPTRYRDFDDYWLPFLDGPSAAPAYLRTLTPPQQDALAARLRDTLPRDADGGIPLTARAWAVRGENG